MAGFLDSLGESLTSSDFLAAAIPTIVGGFASASAAKDKSKLDKEVLARQLETDAFNKQMALAQLYLQYQKLNQGGGGGGGAGAAAAVARDQMKADILQKGVENQMASQNQLLSMLGKEPELAQNAGRLSIESFGNLLAGIREPALRTIRG